MALRIRWGTPEDADAIARVAAEHPDNASFEHLWEYRALVASDRGGAEPWVALAEGHGGRLVGLLPVIVHGGLADGRLEFGRSSVLGDDEDTRRALLTAVVERCREASVRTLALTLPDRALRRGLPGHVDVDHFTQRMTLPESLAAFETALTDKRRNMIRRARREGYATEIGPPDALDAWFACYAAVCQRVNARAPDAADGLRLAPLEAYRMQLDALASHCAVRLVSIVKEGEVFGANLVLVLGRAAFLWRGGLRLKQVGDGAGDLLMHGVVQAALEAGCATVDLGESNEHGAGLYAFKASYGGRHVDNSVVVCDLAGASALSDPHVRRDLLATLLRPAAGALRSELCNFLVGPRPLDATRPSQPGRGWLAVAPAALPRLRLPILGELDGPPASCAAIGPTVAAHELDELVRRTWRPPPLPLAAAIEGVMPGRLAITVPQSLLRRGRPLVIDTIRPAELTDERVRARAEGTDLLLVVQDRADVERLVADSDDGRGGFRLPAGRFGVAPLRIVDLCRLLPSPCPAMALEVLHVDAAGEVHPCRPGPAVGPLGTSTAEATRTLATRADRLAAERACATCPVASRCARCIADAPLGRDASYCDVRRAFPRLGDLALLIEAAALLVEQAARVGEATDGFAWSAPAVAPPDLAPAPAALPVVPADVLGLRLDGRPFVVHLGQGAVREVGDALCDLVGLAREHRSAAAVAAILRRDWEADDDDVAGAFGALGALLGELEAGGDS